MAGPLQVFIEKTLGYNEGLRIPLLSHWNRVEGGGHSGGGVVRDGVVHETLL